MIKRKDKEESESADQCAVVPPDGGYGWVVVGSTCYIYFTLMGSISLTGMLFVELQEYFGASTTYLSLFGSIKMGLILFLATPVAILTRRYGSRVVACFGGVTSLIGCTLSYVAPNVQFLFFSYAFMLAVGGTCGYVSSDIILQQYFTKKRSLVNAIGGTASSIAVFVWPPIGRALFDKYSWRGAVLIIGGISFNMVPAALLFRPVPKTRITTQNEKNYHTLEIETVSDKKPLIDNNKNTHLRQALMYLLIFTSWFAIRSTDTVMLIDTPIRAEEMELSKNQAAMLLSILGASQTITCVPWGILGDRKWISVTGLCVIGSLLSGVSLCISLAYTSFGTMVINSVLYGIGSAAYNGLGGVSVVELLGIDRVEHAIAALFSSYGLAYLVAPLLAGYMYDELGTFWPVITFGVLQIFGGAILLCTTYLK